MFNPLDNLKRLIAQINSVANKGADRVRQKDSSSNPILHSEFREHKLSTRLIDEKTYNRLKEKEKQMLATIEGNMLEPILFDYKEELEYILRKK